MIPTAVANLGKVISILVSSGEEVFEYTFKNLHLLVSDGPGVRLWIFPANKTKKGVKKSARSTVKRASERYALFTDFHPDNIQGHQVSEKKLKRVGRLESIVYESKKWTGKPSRYIHDFKNPPLVKMDNEDDPGMIEVSGGKLKIKPEGITG